MSDHLHYYLCSFCKTSASAAHQHERLACRSCHRWMTFQWTLPVTTDADRVLVARGLVFNPGFEQPTTPPVKRHRCGNMECANRFHATPEAEMVYAPGMGWFCSETCKDAGREQFEALFARVRKLRDEQPDMYFAGTTEVPK